MRFTHAGFLTGLYVFSLCFARCVWIWVFLFGFALRSLAVWLVCAIAPRSVSGLRASFLPSLSEHLNFHSHYPVQGTGAPPRYQARLHVAILLGSPAKYII
jgi:hypothetical protein